MARIRSTHPGQWSDEDFVALSFSARLLALAVRNIADDHGIFEWKPVTLKMQLMPADAIDIVPLLAEMVEHNAVIEFKVGTKRYGAIRNFMKWQRPKRPSYVHPTPETVLEFVGFNSQQDGIEDASSLTIPEHVPNNSPTSTGIVSQRKEEGGRKKEEKKSKTAAFAATTTISSETQSQPAQIVNGPMAGQGSAEDRFWKVQDARISKSMMGKLANLCGGDFDEAASILKGALRANDPRRYLGKVVSEMTKEQAPPVPPDPKLPAWITEARASGYPVEREGEYWRFAGGLFDNNKQQVGN